MAEMIKSMTALLLLLSGCATPSLESSLPLQRPLGRSHATWVPPLEPNENTPAPMDPTDIGGELTLDQAAALALLHNPQLQVFAWSVRVAEARRLQAGLRPNPELDLEMENLAGTGAFEGTGIAETTVGVGQLIEVGGKRAKRTQVAALESELAGWDYEEMRLAVFTEVVQAFTEVLAAQERGRVVDQQVDIAEKVVHAVNQRVQAGKDSPLEATRARVSLAQVRIEQKRLRLESSAVRQSLAATWGASEALFTHVGGALDRIVNPPAPSALQALVVQHPTVARWETEIEQRQARFDLEKANARPNPTVVGGYRHLNEVDESAFVLGLSLPLPVTNRNQGSILAAKAALARARVEQRAALTSIRAELSRAYASLSSEYMTATELQQEVLPGAQEAFDSAQTGYVNGKFDYLTVLDAQRTLFAARTQHLEALVEYHQAKAQVEHLIGQPLESLKGQNHD